MGWGEATAKAKDENSVRERRVDSTGAIIDQTSRKGKGDLGEDWKVSEHMDYLYPLGLLHNQVRVRRGTVESWRLTLRKVRITLFLVRARRTAVIRSGRFKRSFLLFHSISTLNS